MNIGMTRGFPEHFVHELSERMSYLDINYQQQLRNKSNSTIFCDLVRSRGLVGTNYRARWFSPWQAILQIQGLRCVPFSATTELEDAGVFSKTIRNWVEPTSEGPDFALRATADEAAFVSVLERVSYF